MGDSTSIAWTDRTWNPWQGCHPVSEACAHCYMFRDKRRYGQDPEVVVRSSPATFRRPLSKSWATPAKVFTCSWSDFFIEEADPWRAEAWDVIRRTPWLTYQILTKRPERIADHLPPDWGEGWSNVWLGVTVENNKAMNRWGFLHAIPARVRFLSMEPLLELVDPRSLEGSGVDWVIVGAESGPGRRLCLQGWVTRVVLRCHHSEVPCFVKQLHIDGEVVSNLALFPPHLQVREFPR